MSPGWAETYLGLIFQVYGLAFFVLGVTALLSMRRGTDAGPVAHLGWLAAFGMLHGLQEFIDGERLHNPAAWLVVLSMALMVTSFAALLEFGRRQWNERPGGLQLGALPLFVTAGAGTVALMLVAPAAAAGLELGARYLLGVPGATLAGIGLLVKVRTTVRATDTLVISRWLTMAAIAMLGYAALTLFLSPGSGRLLSDWLPTTADFLASTGLPVQLARALCAILLAVGFVVIAQRRGDITAASLQRVTDRLDGFVYRCLNDKSWTVSFMSDGGETLTGYPAADFLRGERHFAEQIHPEDQQRVWDEVQVALAVRRGFCLQYRMIDRTGTVRWCYEEGRGVFDPKGQLLYLEGLVRNDDARHQAEHARRQMQALVEASPQALGWADMDGRVGYFNGALRILLAIPAKVDITNYYLKNFYNDKEYQHIESTVLPTILGGGIWVGEAVLTTLDGRCVPTQHSVFALRDEAGEVSAIANVITDLTELKRAEAALAESESRYRMLFELSTDGIAYADVESKKLTIANSSFADMLGYPLTEIAQLSVHDLHPPDVLPWVLEKFDELASRQIKVVRDIPLLRRDGSVFYADVSASHIISVSGNNLLAGIFRDASQRRMESQRIEDLNEALEARVRERTAQLERANLAKSEFLSRMSHELRTPLNAIIGFTQLLQQPGEQVLSTQQADNLHEIQYAGEHLLRLVNEVLDLARIESGRLELTLQPVALLTLIERSATLITPAAAQRHISLTLPTQHPCTVLADPGRLRQVLLNLLSNAVKYNREGGSIVIDCLPAADQRIRISVRDTGHGLSEVQIDRLFRPFERLESAYEGIEGTGVGLALAKQLVEGMKGTIGVDSVPGEGSCFWFELPICAQDPTPETATTAKPNENTDKSAQQEKSHTILYIEDNPANLRLVQKILAKRASTELLVADNAEAGLLLARRAQPDLILMDINLPGMDGFEALQQLRADPAMSAILVIAISANAMKSDIQRAQQAGFVDYITKPIQVQSFLNCVEHWLSKRTQEVSNHAD